MKHIEPRLEAERRMNERAAQVADSRAFVAHGRNWMHEKPEEVRREYVKAALAKLGYRPEQLGAAMKEADEREAAVDKNKPWWRPMTGEPGRRTAKQLMAESISMDKK